MNLSNMPAALLAACGKDTVKLFDVSKQPDHASNKAVDPCVLAYTPSTGSHVNSVKWNHTTLVVASAGEDKKISFWHINGQKLGAVPLSEGGAQNDIDETIFSINFSNKDSRYLCSGGSSQVVRIWDLQRKRCIKWLRGHSATISGVMYNCKDEYVASSSVKGDLILHSLASGSQTTILKDPDEQILRVLDFSCTGRHVLATAGDDGSMHLWDTTGRSPKDSQLRQCSSNGGLKSRDGRKVTPGREGHLVFGICNRTEPSIGSMSPLSFRYQNSWKKLHSAPTTGISFSPSNDKVLVSVGLDKKLHIVDSRARNPVFSTSYEAPFSSLAFQDDGSRLAAGTSDGRVAFYDVRGKPQPMTALCAYGVSVTVTSLSWQRSRPDIVNESACSDDNALLGVTGEDYIVMPDSLPSLTSSNFPLVTSIFSSRGSAHSGFNADVSLRTSTRSAHTSNGPYLLTVEGTTQQHHLSVSEALPRLHVPLSSYNYNDDMDVFSPVVEVHPITPSLDPRWNDHDASRIENKLGDNKLNYQPLFSGKLFSSENEKTSFHPISDWKSNSSSWQNDTQTSLSLVQSMPNSSFKNGQPFSTPPEAWGAGLPNDKFPLPQLPPKPSPHFMASESAGSAGLITGSHSSSSLDFLTPNYSISSTLTTSAFHMKDIDRDEYLLRFSDHSYLPAEVKNEAVPRNHDISTSTHSVLPRKLSCYAERISTSSFGKVATLGAGTTKLNKTGLETREEIKNLSRLHATGATTGSLSCMNHGVDANGQRSFAQAEEYAGSTFTLQLFQKTLEEALILAQNSMHEDIRNLHIEVLRQFHMQETKMDGLVSSVLEKVTELTKEVQTLRKENERLRQLL